jgi:hypothetical protein
MTRRRGLSLRSARAACRRWQRSQRLEDWTVKLEIVRMSTLGGGSLAECEPHGVKRQARIRLLDPRDVEGQAFWFDGEAWNWELSLVHELLHLHMWDVHGGRWPGDTTPEGIAAERLIDAVAKALAAA